MLCPGNTTSLFFLQSIQDSRHIPPVICRLQLISRIAQELFITAREFFLSQFQSLAKRFRQSARSLFIAMSVTGAIRRSIGAARFILNWLVLAAVLKLFRFSTAKIVNCCRYLPIIYVDSSGPL